VAFSIGQVVGDYRIIDVIGSGGMGTVYKVQHSISDRIEAMKVILPDLIGTPELAERFVREIRVQARLSHPNIASLHNAFRFENQMLMVMEYVDGATLHSVLRQGKLDSETSVEVALQVLGALTTAHAQGIVHRDIKPANIMIATGSTVKLMDFGIARSLTDQHLTQTGAAVGSVYYMSPEQVQGTEIDGRSDLYSVGIVLYEMVTGVRPITGDSSWAVMNAHISVVPRSPAALNPDLPPPLCAAILKAVEKKPPERFQTAPEFADALRTASAQRIPWSRGDAAQSANAKEQIKNMPETELHASPPIAVATPTPSGNKVKPARLFEPEELGRVRQDLAVYVGPMAKILVDRAAKKAASMQDLYEILSAEVPAGHERKKFLAMRPR
jgi:eukaryotic-like serine/threonine-protein kinase